MSPVDNGSVWRGFASQTWKNTRLEPWYGANTASAEPSTRKGQKLADKLFMTMGPANVALGGAGLWYLGKAPVSHGLVKGLSSAGTHGISGPKVLAGGLVALGLVQTLTGARNLYWSKPEDRPSIPPGKPKPTPTPEPTPTPTPGPTPPGKPPTLPPTPPFPPPGPGLPEPEPKQPVPDPGQRPPAKSPVQDRPQRPPLRTHTVKPNENLTLIAECYDRTWKQVYWRNREQIGPNPDQVRPGQRLVIPRAGYEPPGFSYRPTYDPNGDPGSIYCPPNDAECRKKH